VKAVIIGGGFIGKAQARMLAGHDVTVWDETDGTSYPHAAVWAADMAVICVGTPQAEDGSADLSGLRRALGDLALGGLAVRVPVLIRSTVPPGTTAWVAGIWGRPVCHAPEFMHERQGGAWAESADVPFLILGGTPEARDYFLPLLAEFFPKIHECDAVTAELAKYVINLHLATRVTFINEMDAICRAVGADWEDVRQAWLCDPRITPEYTGGIAEFGPGFGGRCWPKDLAALIHAARGAGYEPGFLEAVQEANGRFRG
jgi:UDPglucose 6-dehydrogenase